MIRYFIVSKRVLFISSRLTVLIIMFGTVDMLCNTGRSININIIAVLTYEFVHFDVIQEVTQMSIF